ncbi:MAG TPA: DNA gyrase inhibitor YacG [Sphingomonas bacterium]|jgi:endogenous inhibitor of DNA gyrase (YacG/DUF329 family)|uniref:DNA gyrase inhibitor YacG n=1 Tax=Sphingomonas bacterium TaxID=1895847 RepID=A0A3D0WBV4_9SPHN|nr:DNA gyrase inhibitor YacG [Sphingomonas bacterium]
MTKSKGCPICDRPATPEHAPFCSQGCRDRDLLQWLGEGYRLPGRPVDPMEIDGLDRGDSPD